MILRNRNLGDKMNRKKSKESATHSTTVNTSSAMKHSCDLVTQDKLGKESSCDLVFGGQHIEHSHQMQSTCNLVLRDTCLGCENDRSLNVGNLNPCRKSPVQGPDQIIDLVCSPCSTEDVVFIQDEFCPDVEVVNKVNSAARKREFEIVPPLHDGAAITEKRRKRTVWDDNAVESKRFNDSIEIICEISKVEDVPLKKKRKNIVGKHIDTDSLKNEDSNNSIINLCNDDDDVIVDLNSKSVPDSKKPSTKTNDIILLDTKHSLQSNVTSTSKTCTTTNNNFLKIEPFSDSHNIVACDPYQYTSQVPPSYSYVMPFFYMDTKGDPNYNVQSSSRHKYETSSYGGVPLQTSPSNSAYGNNIYNPNPKNDQTGLRPVIIDGSNVAFSHSGGQKLFSCRGIDICVKYFTKRGHKVVAFVPQFRRSSSQVQDRNILDELEKAGQVVFTPSRRVEGQLQVPYDDRYIVQYAAEMGGVIVSTDNFRDLLKENESWRETIQNRLLMFTWVGDMLMFPQDPLGRYGPKLEEFLRFPS